MNWEEVRQEYESTDITLKALAEKHDIKLGTLKSRKSREGWSRGSPKKDATKPKKVATPKKKDATEKDAISWIDIENEYVTDIRRKPCTLRSLAEKYNVSMSRIEKYAAENDWSTKRSNYAESVQEKHKQKTAERISDDLAEATARHFRVSDKLLSVIESALEDDNEFYKVVEKLRTGYGPGEFSEEIVMETVDALNESKLLNVVNAADKLQKMQRQTLGILDVKDQHKIEMDRKKFGGDDEEYEDDGFNDALHAMTAEVWADDNSEGEES
nr:hypothetical protein [Bacillus badius]